MKETFFRTLSWLHTWAGLLVCWVLLLIFFAGTLSYFRHEMSQWSEPELHQNVFRDYQTDALVAQLDKGQAYLEQHAPQAQRWLINLPTERRPYLSYGWQLPPEKGQRRGKIEEHFVSLDDTMITQVRSSRGGDFFYRLHFDLHYMSAITARYIVGICTMFMLIALLSGIVIHKRIFKDLFSFRRGKSARAWLDAHNVSSVIALPYHLMITYTGLITLMLMYIPWTATTAYSGDNQAFLNDLNPGRQNVKAVGITAPQIAFSQLLPKIQATWGDAPIKQLSISNPKDQQSHISVFQNTGKDVTDEATVLVFNATTGEQIFASEQVKSGAEVTYDTMMSLHTARFAQPILRFAFFFCGLLGCAMVATGTLMWALRLRQKQQKQLDKGQNASWGLRLVEGLNFTFILGLPFGAVAFFYANRLLPTTLAQRSEWEVHCFFIALAGMGLWAAINHSRRQWQHALLLLAVLTCALPVLNAITSTQSIVGNIQTGQWGLVGFDLVALFFGLAIMFARSKVQKSTQQIKGPSTAPKKSRPNAMSSTGKTATSLKEVNL